MVDAGAGFEIRDRYQSGFTLSRRLALDGDNLPG